MRIVLQVVTGAAVTVEDRTVGSIDGPGLALLVGITHSDTVETAQKLAAKIAGLRVLPGETSCESRGAPVLAVSQFTLYGDVRKGRRPSWSAAAPGPVSEPLFDAFVAALGERGLTVATGEFGAHMEVSLVNDGPMTLVLDSDELERPRRP
ncbi:D-aminoacyl-tRNA deacylase [Kocuria varians]|uniref:D-aminoacyl-tRNA deacylase n=1 Tax=Kocuria varians TaxID=1272 RepID=UPI000838F631|nr:D-aminoacyl-tRNA deacylase [Kocuria varians]